MRSPGGRALVAPGQPLESVRTLLVHEWLYTWAGAERCLEELLTILPHADILAGVVTPEMRASHPAVARARESWVGRVPGARSHHRWFLPLHAAAFAAFDTSGYDLVISISHAFEKVIRPREGVPHVCYCLTPPRWLYDLSETYAGQSPPLQRVALRAAAAPLRALDRRGARGVHRFVSISRTVAGRVKRVYGRESDVVYPPVAVKPGATTTRREPFVLSLGRLVPYKRVDLAIAAAERLGLRLVVAGDGPERGRLERLAGPNTEFAGAVSEAEAGRLLSACSAFVFCGEEDFGIAPIEANAHGAPVVGFRRGGLTETMQDDATAIMFERQSVDAVSDALRRCLDRSWDAVVLRRNAERFSPERFRDQMTQILLDAGSRVSPRP